MLMNLYDFYQDLKANRILFCYSGPIAQSSIEGVGSSLRKNLEVEEAGNTAKLSVFSIFVEQVQNILNYSAEKLVPSEELDNDLRVGVVSIGHEENGDYFIYCGNRIFNVDIPKLSEKIEYVNSLNKDELKTLYKKRRRMSSEPGSKGAGLGLIEIARRAGKSLEYSFSEIDDVFSFFNIKVIVGR